MMACASFTPGMAQTCSSNVPHVQGVWKTLPYFMPINPISATLLHNGKVLIVAGSENDANNNSPGSESYRNAVWDPAGTNGSSITVQNIAYDVFCSGTVALPDGRSLVIGGTSSTESSYNTEGDNRASIFDPATQQFAQSQSMVDGRWYGTATTLGDGRVMAFSGLNGAGGTNKTVEIYDLRNAGAGWSPPATAPFTPPLYPRMFLLPNGKVFNTGQGVQSPTNAFIFDPASMTWTISVPPTMDRTYGSAVMLPLLPPNYTPKVMNFGGGSPATPSTEIIDLSAASPTWTPGPNMSTGRVQMNATILPNGKVLAHGGSVNNESPDPAGRQGNLYDPVANTMISAGTATYSRLYHSTSLLLPDATVVSMGSNPGPRGQYEPAIEIYMPPYLFDANDHFVTNRPTITGVSSSRLGYNATFSVTYTSASTISSAVLMRPGSATHAIDMDQRLIGLCGAAPQPACSGTGTLTLTTPPNSNIAPPGYYMLFLLDSAGVPSVASFIQLTPYTTTPPTGTITSPSSGVNITAGGAVSFSGSSSGSGQYSWVFPGGSPTNSTAQNPGSVTFPQAGTFTTSLTAIDSTGNSDPSPPTRTIWALPASPDFSIAVTPSAVTAIPGQSATFTVTVTPLSGFTGTVNLSVSSENGLPSGISSAGFSPASISGGNGSSTLTMNTSASAAPYALSLTVTGTSGSITHTGSTTLLVNLAAPASLTATPGTGQVALSWPASAAATGYHVKRSLIAGGPYVGIGCATTTSFTDTAVTNGTTYYYVVSASYTGGPDAGGESADSPEASATPQGTGDTQPPTAPGNLAITGVTSSQINLGWNASTDNVGVNAYLIERCQGSGCSSFSQIGMASGTATAYSDTTVAGATVYSYRVRAEDAAGNLSSYSNIASATTQPAPPPPAPAAPTNLTAASGNPKGGILIRWTQSTSPGVRNNNIYRRTSTGSYPSTSAATLSATTTYQDSKLTSGATYCYVVTAVNSGGESARSNEACGTAK